MPVKIDKISVKNLGPLPHFEEEFGIFNIIYSQNEKGKTFLTEFIIRSLFKNYNRWDTIRKSGQGKVWVSGLADQPITFSPSTGKKLEDFWKEQEKGLPASTPNILMAKGSEASINQGG